MPGMEFPCSHTGGICMRYCPLTACAYDLDEAVWPEGEDDPMDLSTVPGPVLLEGEQ